MTLYPEMNEKQKEEMWDEIAQQLSKPKSMRPQHKELYTLYGLPESTYYWTTSKKEFKQRIVEKCVNEAKEWMPELIEVLKEKAIVDKSEKSIEMALKYIAEIAEKIDHTSKGEKIGMTKEEEQTLNALLYGTNKQIGTGESDQRDTTGENVSVQ